MTFSCNLFIQLEYPTNLAYHTCKTSLTAAGTHSWRSVVYLDSVTIDKIDSQSRNLQVCLGKHVVCSCHMWDISHYYFIHVEAAWRQWKPLPNISMSNGLAYTTFCNVGNLCHICFRKVHVLFDLSPILTNVTGCGVLLVLALSLRGLPSDCDPTVLNWYHCLHCCRCHCLY